MLGALLYLRATSFRNWLRSRALRLRQPKYLVGAIVGVAYFYFFFFRAMHGATPPGAASGPAALALRAEYLPVVAAVGAAGLLALATCLWVVPSEPAALGFSEAEIAFLFPAPITRRGLIHFRLLSGQFRSLAGAVVMTLFSNRWTFLGGNAFTHAIGWWFVFSGLNLHLTGARFTLTRLAGLGLATWRRRLLVLLAVAAVVSASWARLPPVEVPAGAALPVLELFRQVLLPLAGTAPLSWLLWPFEVVLGPFLAPSTPAFLAALPPAVAILLLQYLWVVHSAVAFEEASVEQGAKRAARIAAWRSGRRGAGSTTARPRPAPFALRPGGRPELAFLWKNLLSTWPYFTGRVLAGAAAVLAAGALWARTQPLGRELLPGLAALAAVLGGYILLVGPQFARQDIRADLTHADILKTYPLAGWQVVLGELLTPVAILTGSLWLTLLTTALGAGGGAAPDWLSLPVQITGAVCLAVLIPFLAALQLLVPNAAALVFPGWYQATRGRGGGPEVIGQRMIFFFAQLLTMVLALTPAALFGGALAAIAWSMLGPLVALLLSTPVIALILAAEVATGIWLLGRQFERLDLSAELRA